MIDAADIRDLRPYDGTVTARFSDAIVASSENAMVATDPVGEALFFVPLDDVYFDFFRPAEEREATHDLDRRWWTVNAVGEAGSMALWAMKEPPGHLVRLRDYGCFNTSVIDIEATPRPKGDNSTELP